MLTAQCVPHATLIFTGDEFYLRHSTKVDRGLYCRKSSSQDKGEGALDKAKGKAKEAIGAVTGDEEKKAEGRSDKTKGTAKDKLGKAKDLLK
jgi:uncharacterized protein YjbJ (UPF0337 family)